MGRFGRKFVEGHYNIKELNQQLVKIYQNLLKKKMNKFDIEYYWEIRKNGYLFTEIIKNIEKAGFEVKKTYRIFEYP